MDIVGRNDWEPLDGHIDHMRVSQALFMKLSHCSASTHSHSTASWLQPLAKHRLANEVLHGCSVRLIGQSKLNFDIESIECTIRSLHACV